MLLIFVGLLIDCVKDNCQSASRGQDWGNNKHNYITCSSESIDVEHGELLFLYKPTALLISIDTRY